MCIFENKFVFYHLNQNNEHRSLLVHWNLMLHQWIGCIDEMNKSKYLSPSYMFAPIAHATELFRVHINENSKKTYISIHLHRDFRFTLIRMNDTITGH